MNLIGSYNNGTYKVYLWDDGTKVREAPNDVFEADRPECIDVGISTKCNNKCLYCYMGASPDGSWANFNRFKFLDNLPEYLEVNINLNFPINPDLKEFLERMKQQKVIVNATINSKHLLQKQDYVKELSKDGLIHGLGVSYNANYIDDALKVMAEIPNSVVHVIAGCFTKKDLKKLRNKNLKLLILGYKNIGRGNNFYKTCHQLIDDSMAWLKDELPKMVDDFALISFDNLAIEQLHVKDWVDAETWEERYLGEDAQTSFYIDLVRGFYAPSSLSDDHRKIGNKTLQEMFDDIRGKV